MERPKFVLICGPNGAGKSTYTRTVKSALENATVVDVDDLAHKKKLSDVEAGREAIKLIDNLIGEKKSFVRESTISSNYDLKLIRRLKDNGYDVSVLYIGVDSPELSIKRIEERVKSGGHNVDRKDVERRYQRGLSKIVQAAKIADNAVIMDNSNLDHQIVANLEKGRIVSEDKKTKRDWFESIKREISDFESQKILAESQKILRDNKALEESIGKYDSGLAIYMTAQKTKMEKLESDINNKIIEKESEIGCHNQKKPGVFNTRKTKDNWNSKKQTLEKELNKLKNDKKKILAAKNEKKIIESFRQDNPELAKEQQEAAQELNKRVLKEQDKKRETAKEREKEATRGVERILSIKR